MQRSQPPYVQNDAGEAGQSLQMVAMPNPMGLLGVCLDLHTVVSLAQLPPGYGIIAYMFIWFVPVATIARAMVTRSPHYSPLALVRPTRHTLEGEALHEAGPNRSWPRPRRAARRHAHA